MKMNPRDLNSFRIKKLNKHRKDFVLGQSLALKKQMPPEVEKDLDGMLSEFQSKATVADLDSHRDALANRLKDYAKTYDAGVLIDYSTRVADAYDARLRDVQIQNS